MSTFIKGKKKLNKGSKQISLRMLHGDIMLHERMDCKRYLLLLHVYVMDIALNEEFFLQASFCYVWA